MDDASQPPESPTYTSLSLLARVKNRQQDGWERFVTLYCPLIYDACRKFGLQPSDADDVTQEVLSSVSQAIDAFKKEHSGDSFRGWLYRIVQNKVRDHFRRLNKHPQGVGGSDYQWNLNQVPEELSNSSVSNRPGGDPVLTRSLEMIRSEFQEKTWTAFWRLTVEGHLAADIAADLGMQTNAVRQAKFRIMQRLRTEFGDLIDLPE